MQDSSGNARKALRLNALLPNFSSASRRFRFQLIAHRRRSLCPRECGSNKAAFRPIMLRDLIFAKGYGDMIAALIAFALLLAAQPQNGSSDSGATARPHDEYERHRQTAIRVNDLAESIQSEVDANAVVSKIAALFSKELPSTWPANGINQRVARAEYDSVRDPSKRIPEQRIVDVWNEYLKEIRAPNEAIASGAEIHNMRDASFTAAQMMWARGNQTICFNFSCG
jgi:hypothetical protein